MENNRLIQQDSLLESVLKVSNILKQQCPDMNIIITQLAEVQALLTKDNLSSDDLDWIDKAIGYLCHFKCLYDFCPLKLLEGETDQERWQRWGQILDQMKNRADLLCGSMKENKLPFSELCICDIENFNMFDKIVSLKWEVVFDNESWEEHRYLVLEMVSSDNYKILIECKDVDSFHFQGNGQIAGFYIKDMSVRGYENNSRYEVGDYEENSLEFYCSDVIIKSLEKME